MVDVWETEPEVQFTFLWPRCGLDFWGGGGLVGGMSLVERQLEKLNLLIEKVRGDGGGGNGFYLGKLGGVERVGSVGEFFERVPFTTKSELAEDRRGEWGVWDEFVEAVGGVLPVPPDEWDERGADGVAG